MSKAVTNDNVVISAQLQKKEGHRSNLTRTKWSEKWVVCDGEYIMYWTKKKISQSEPPKKKLRLEHCSLQFEPSKLELILIWKNSQFSEYGDYTLDLRCSNELEFNTWLSFLEEKVGNGELIERRESIFASPLKRLSLVGRASFSQPSQLSPTRSNSTTNKSTLSKSDTGSATKDSKFVSNIVSTDMGDFDVINLDETGSDVKKSDNRSKGTRSKTDANVGQPGESTSNSETGEASTSVSKTQALEDALAPQNTNVGDQNVGQSGESTIRSNSQTSEASTSGPKTMALEDALVSQNTNEGDFNKDKLGEYNDISSDDCKHLTSDLNMEHEIRLHKEIEMPLNKQHEIAESSDSTVENRPSELVNAMRRRRSRNKAKGIDNMQVRVKAAVKVVEDDDEEEKNKWDDALLDSAAAGLRRFKSKRALSNGIHATFNVLKKRPAVLHSGWLNKRSKFLTTAGKVTRFFLLLKDDDNVVTLMWFDTNVLDDSQKSSMKVHDASNADKSIGRDDNYNEDEERKRLLLSPFVVPQGAMNLKGSRVDKFSQINDTSADIKTRFGFSLNGRASITQEPVELVLSANDARDRQSWLDKFKATGSAVSSFS